MRVILERAIERPILVVRNPKVRVDIEVHSVFTRKRHRIAEVIRLARHRLDRRGFVKWRLSRDYGVGEQGPAKRHVWYTGENLRPPEGWDVTLSFDVDSFGGSNFYLPHWAIRTGDLGFRDEMDAMSVGSETFSRPRRVEAVPEKFACVVASNPHPIRQVLVSALSQVGPVDGFGRAYNRPIESKARAIKDYKFCITPENDLYPGYVTEKPFEAWLAGTVPVWWGDDSLGFLDMNAVLNLHGQSLDDLLIQLTSLHESESAWAQFASHRLLTKTYDYSALIGHLKEHLH